MVLRVGEEMGCRRGMGEIEADMGGFAEGADAGRCGLGGGETEAGQWQGAMGAEKKARKYKRCLPTPGSLGQAGEENRSPPSGHWPRGNSGISSEGTNSGNRVLPVLFRDHYKKRPLEQLAFNPSPILLLSPKITPGAKEIPGREGGGVPHSGKMRQGDRGEGPKAVRGAEPNNGVWPTAEGARSILVYPSMDLGKVWAFADKSIT